MPSRPPKSLLALSACFVATLAVAETPDGPAQHVALPQPDDSHLTGRDIFQRVVENRFDSYIQSTSLRSGDHAGNEQETRLKMWYQSYLGDDDKPEEGNVVSKTVVKYTHPFEIRHTGYMVINNFDRGNDQFVYRPSSRRIRRVSLRGEAVFGTDFSFEDVVPRELEDATYTRLDDGEEQGKAVWIIDAVPKPEVDSEYSKIRVYVEKDRAVPLRSRYWDGRGTEFKELFVSEPFIEENHGIWIPMNMKMQNTKLDTYTYLVIDDIVPNVDIPRSEFDLRRLIEH